MNIHNLKFIEQLYPNSIKPVNQNTTSPTISPENEKNFTNLLNQSLNSLEVKQLESEQASKDLVMGEADNLHSIMITATEAQLSLELAVQLRNRCLDAMNEIKNMQF